MVSKEAVSRSVSQEIRTRALLSSYRDATAKYLAEEQIQVDRFSSFDLTFSAAMFFGVQFESISKERLYVAKLSA